ncbi:replication-associated protein [Delphin virus 2]|nr:replication-associated protein [Delphin virus 2]QSX73082.1 replication-associated protein [Delphin virus 2]
MAAQGTRWCFTLNNPTDQEKDRVATLLSDDRRVKYGVVGRESGESGAPHLQGFVIFRSNRRFGALHRLLPRAHFELTRGTSQQAGDYCKKDGDFDEYGEPPSQQGRRTDLEALVQWGDEFTTANGRPPTSPEVAQAQPTAYLRFPRLVRLFDARQPPPNFNLETPRDWQRELADELDEEAEDRHVIFYVDEEGGKGKTWFQKWYLQTRPNRAQVLSIGKRDDIAHVVDVTRRVFFFNIPRGGMEFLQYQILEQLKDQMVFSPKYNSKMKILPARCHVVVFSNELPAMDRMSVDRYVIRSIEE